MANYFRCSECGRYISYKDDKAVSYTHYGTTTDYEPPEPVYVCGRCYTKMTPEQQKIIHQSAWIKPHRLFGKEEIKIMSKQSISEEMGIHKQWYKEARNMTLDKLSDFVNHLINGYNHDYGTICHALTAGAIATMWAMNRSSQGGITDFQASCIMWAFIRQWKYSYNKTGLRLIDYDNFLYPQCADKFQKILSPDIWKNIQKAAQAEIEKADKEYAEYLVAVEQYKKDLAAFIEKYPDYYERKEYYDHLSYGTIEQWDEYRKKKESGFEFAPQKPFCIVTPESPVYHHWKSIVAGNIPFGYTIADDL